MEVFFFSFHSRLVHAQDGRLDQREVSVQSVGFLFEFFELLEIPNKCSKVQKEVTLSSTN